MNTSKSMGRYFRHGMIAAVAVWGACHAFAADRDSKLDRKETAFIKDAAQGGQAEVQVGKLAAAQGQNQSIKQLGQMLQDDHSKANQELTQIAQQLGVEVPAQPDRKENRTMEKLQSKSGAEFDKAFAEHAIEDHVKDIQKFEKALQDCKDPSLKAFIEKNIPVLRHHLQMARTAGMSVGADQKILSSADRYISEQTGRNSSVGTSGASQTGKSLEQKNQDQNGSSSSPSRPDNQTSGSSRSGQDSK